MDTNFNGSSVSIKVYKLNNVVLHSLVSCNMTETLGHYIYIYIYIHHKYVYTIYTKMSMNVEQRVCLACFVYSLAIILNVNFQGSQNLLMIHKEMVK